MGELYVAYDKMKVNKKRPFNADDITDTLMSEPMNIDLNQIAHTPVAVIVNLPKEEYIKKGIGNFISRKYDVFTICKDNMLVIKSISDNGCFDE